MPRVNRILWGEGMFLRPQHFQQQDACHNDALKQVLRQIHAFPWGVRKVALDGDGLRNGQLRLNALELTFQDGLTLYAPEQDPIPAARNLQDIPHIGTSTVVYACLSVLTEFGLNGINSDAPVIRVPRFTTDSVDVADLYTNAPQTEVLTLRTHVRLLVEQEDRNDQLSVAIARISKNATGTWTLDDDYIPPLLDIAGSPYLDRLIRRLLEIMLVKSQALAASHRERVKSVVEFGTSDISSFWLLHAINRSFPVLNHLARTSTHPEALYVVLAQFCGELMTFSASLTLNEIPPYVHHQLTGVFPKIDTMLRELLETVISTQYAMIALANTKPSFFIGRLESERLVDNVDFYLSISGETPIEGELATVPTKLKIGSPDDVEKILHSAMPGVRLIRSLQTPPALPVRVGNHYFTFEPHGAIFERMLKARSICIYVPQTLSALKMELIAVFR